VFSASTKRKRSGRQGAPCFDAGLSARVPRVRAMKNPARFPGRAFEHTCKGYLFVPESRFIVKIFFPTEFFSGELFFAAAFDGKTISQASVLEGD
jgi:hypothetical protein